MKSRDGDSQSSRSASQAINIVLKAEQDAERDIDRCRKNAADTLNNARSRSARIAQRTNERITNIHLRSKQKLAALVTEMERRASNELRIAEAEPVDDKKIARAMQDVAAMLIDSMDAGKPD